MSVEAALEISFPASSSADATRLARDLRSAIADEGVPASGIDLKRADPENMDAGSVLAITALVVHSIVAADGVYRFFEIMRNFTHRTGSAIWLRSPIGEIHIRPDTADPQKLAEILQKIAELHRARSDK